MEDTDPMDGRVKFELTPDEIHARGLRLAEVQGLIEERTEAKKNASAAYNKELGELKKEQKALAMAMREGWEWRPEAEQEEMDLAEAPAGAPPPPPPGSGKRTRGRKSRK